MEDEKVLDIYNMNSKVFELIDLMLEEMCDGEE